MNSARQANALAALAGRAVHGTGPRSGSAVYRTSLKRVTTASGNGAWEVRDNAGRLIVSTGSRLHAGRIRNQAEADLDRIEAARQNNRI